MFRNSTQYFIIKRLQEKKRLFVYLTAAAALKPPTSALSFIKKAISRERFYAILIELLQAKSVREAADTQCQIEKSLSRTWNPSA